ncbi:MAG: glutaredoxin family protein [Actinomycetota bacterium]|nr:glutaredoxin family protein [Actinomycetota bacterium]
MRIQGGEYTELGGTPPRVVIYSKPGCHLCEDARVVVEAVCAELGENYGEIDITASEDLMRTYGEEIPVTLVDGKQHDFWRVDANRLRLALRQE